MTIEILSESENDTLAVVISGTLTSDDYEKLRPEMDLRADANDEFDLLCELDDVSGLEPSAIRDDLMFVKDYAKSIRRMAVVTDESILGRVAEFLGEPFAVAIGVDYERFDDRVAAWKWLRSDPD